MVTRSPNTVDVLVEYKDGEEILFVNKDRLFYQIGGKEYSIPPNYHSDGYSIPPFLKWIFRWLFRRHPLLIFAAIFHDWSNDIDSGFGGERWLSDKLFSVLMEHYGMPWLYNKIFHAAVKAFAWRVWKTQKMNIDEIPTSK